MGEPVACQRQFIIVAHPISPFGQVRMTNSEGESILGKDGKPIWTREYQFTRQDGSKVIIQDH
ncbi:hypothetical protein OS31_48700 [Dickeya oryzae]